MDDQESIFKALADETRRKLLDNLFQRDGQTLMELCGPFDMTRHGVMKHLQILEDAGLVITQKVGREKYHYLNPVPIHQAYDRWISKYAQSWAQGLDHLKNALEEDLMNSRPAHIYQTFISTTPQRLWQALTDGTFTQQYYMGSRVEADWIIGGTYRYLNPQGEVLVEGEILDIDPPRKLVKTFRASWLPTDQQGEPTTVTFEIEPVGRVCKLTLIHENLQPGNAVTQNIQTGWSQILSGLKTLLETGKPLDLGT